MFEILELSGYGKTKSSDRKDMVKMETILRGHSDSICT